MNIFENLLQFQQKSAKIRVGKCRNGIRWQNGSVHSAGDILRISGEVAYEETDGNHDWKRVLHRRRGDRQMVAERLGFTYYDKQIIDHTADILNISVDAVESHNEKPVSYASMFGYQYGSGLYAGDPSLSLPIGMKVANTQFDLVRRYGEEGNCVIVGRCADDILHGRENLLTVFIRGDMEHRLARAERLYGLDAKQAEKLIRKTDRVRAGYYANYTGKKVGRCVILHDAS